jgi:hypothetical protein
MKLRVSLIGFISLSLTSCAWFSSPPKKSTLTLPKVPPVTVPGGSGDNWRYLGTSSDNQLVVEINDKSISVKGVQIYAFQDRKMVVAPHKFSSYLPNQPHYKYIITNWQMDCNNKQYLIETATLYNEVGAVLLTYDYSQNVNVKWIKFGSGSIAELQYNYICLNQNRMLGY